MKKVLLYTWVNVLVLCLANNAIAKQMYFKYSKPTAVLMYMEAAARYPRVSPTFFDYIWSSLDKEDSLKLADLVDKYTGMNIDYRYDVPGYPEERLKPKTTYEQIQRWSVMSATMDEFFSNLIGIVPNEQYVELVDILAKAEVLYTNSIERKYGHRLKKQVKQLNKRDKKINEAFSKISTFYGSIWKPNIPFAVAAYTIPGSKGITTATPHSNSLIVGLLSQEQDIDIKTSVAIHEMCHVLYEEQPKHLQWKIDTLFKNRKWNAATYAYNYLDEALATTLGNGWSYWYITGRQDTGDWYNDGYINKYAHALYPIVASYLRQDKTIDAAFVDTAIKIFESTFPDANYEVENIMNRVHVYVSTEVHEEYSQIMSEMNRSFRISSNYSTFPILDKDVLELLQTSNGVQILYVFKDNEKTLDILKQKFTALQKQATFKEGIYFFIDEKERPILLINARGIAGIKTALKKVSQIGKFSKTQMYYPID